MVTRLITLLVLFTSFAANALTELSATVDKNPVNANESFVLTVSADAKMSTSRLDTSALPPELVVANTRSSTQTQIINGNISHQTRWTIMLIARTEGTYTIPAFTIDGVSSRPIAVRVQTATAGATNNDNGVFIETEVDQTQAYLQSAIRYTVKLYLKYNIQSGTLSDPQMENANIVKVVDDQEDSETIDGVRYRVVIRNYTITPQRSGDYQIKAPVFTGELILSQRRSLFSGFNNTKPVSVMGDDINIKVLPIPDDYAGQWLPSELVTLHEQWQPQSDNYQVGDPITRTISLTAVGVAEEQLPEIDIPYPPGVKTYPDQSTLHSTYRNEKLIAQRKHSVAIVPGKPGELMLPAVKIPWWNTRTNKLEYASLPAKTVTVSAGATASQSVQPPVSAPETAPLQTSSAAPEQVIVEQNSLLTWIFLALWLLTSLAWGITAMLKKRSSDKPAGVSGATSGQTYWKQFGTACKSADARAANQAILRWGRARWPEQNFASSMAVATFLGSPAVIEQIKVLQQHLYGANSGQWQGKDLYQALNANKNPMQNKNSDALAPLHL